MKYAEARNRIKTGDMLLWRASTQVGHGGFRNMVERWFVSHGTASPYTHVGVAWVEYGRVWVMEITTKGCAPRLLSTCGEFDWSPCPKPVSETALTFAFNCFGSWTYSRWQAIAGALRRLTIGDDNLGQCAEYALSIWVIDGQRPTETATPAECAYGAMRVWQSSIFTVEISE